MPRSLASLLAALLLTSATGSATARPDTVTIVHRGQAVQLVGRPGGTPGCLAAVTYADGVTQNIGIKYAVLGKVSWTIKIPARAPIGPAHWSIRCGPTWSVDGSWRVAAVAVPLPVVSLTNDGFSQRPDANDLGSRVSFGLFLKNTSAKRDAKNVHLLVNFVSRNGALVGSTSRTVPLIAAGQTFAFGDGAGLTSRTAVARLEVAVRVGGGATAAAQQLARIANVKIVPDQTDPAWVAEVDGEIANDAATKTMGSAQVSVVVLDANGRISGGGRTTVTSALPPGARTLFALQNGVTSIPAAKAARALVSALPRY